MPPIWEPSCPGVLAKVNPVGDLADRGRLGYVSRAPIGLPKPTETIPPTYAAITAGSASQSGSLHLQRRVRGVVLAHQSGICALPQETGSHCRSRELPVRVWGATGCDLKSNTVCERTHEAVLEDAMEANGRNNANRRATVSLPVDSGLPSYLRINPAVLAATLPEAIQRHRATIQDPAHLRRYMELHIRIARMLNADQAEPQSADYKRCACE